MDKLQAKISANIRKLAHEKGLSIEALADNIEMSRTFLFAFLNGHKSISLNSLSRIAEGLQVSVETLLKN